jgi:small subunit ribosomal protein S7
VSRKKIIIEEIQKRLKPDPKFGNIIVTSFINQLMERGKKNMAQRIFYNAMDVAEKKINKPAAEIFNKALENVKPVLEVRSRRVGGATYQVPVQVRQNRRNSLAIRWIIQSARERKGRSMIEKLAEEIMEAYKGEGAAVKKKDETHKMAEANKAFAHYRW